MRERAAGSTSAEGLSDGIAGLEIGEGVRCKVDLASEESVVLIQVARG